MLELPVTGIAESLLEHPGLYGRGRPSRALGEPGQVSGASLSIDEGHADTLYAACENMPTVAGVSLKTDARRAFETLMDTGAGAIRYVMGAVAFVITFGIVYNAARIARAAREHDLASLRVIGFATKGEAAFVLLGELAVVTLVALPLGAALGYYLSFGIAAGSDRPLPDPPVVFDPASYGFAALVVLGAALMSGWLVKRDVDRTDLVSALKTRE